MSDIVILSIIANIISPILIAVLTYFQNKKIKANGEKVDAYHKEINGRMGELIETTKKLGNAEGTAEEKARNKKLPKTL